MRCLGIFKVVLPVAISGALLLSWGQFAGDVSRQGQGYRRCLKLAEESYQKGLYEQAVEYYKNSLEYKNVLGVYDEICKTCKVFYEEEDSKHARNLYIQCLLEAAEAVPENAEYWVTAVKMYKEAEDYSSAYSTVKKALNKGTQTEELIALYRELKYMFQIDYQLYTEYKNWLGGYISLYNADGWVRSNPVGKVTSSQTYQFLGMINDNGWGLYTNDIDTRMLDKNEVVRARFDFSVQDAGIYSPESGWMPVRKELYWQFMNLEGEFLPGEYQHVSCFVNGKAAVETKDGGWYLINTQGEKVSEVYQDIKLDLSGSYLRDGVILAKSGDAYHIYQSDWTQVSDFSCEDIDICLGDNWIAYKDGGKWGFVDKEGNVKIEPAYEKAKSFSNGLAAVCQNQKWGFIDTTNTLVIDYQFTDATYFNRYHYCLISQDDENYQFMHLMFD